MTPTYCLAGVKPSALRELLFQAGDLTLARDTRLTELQESKIKIKSYFFFLDLLVGITHLYPHVKPVV